VLFSIKSATYELISTNLADSVTYVTLNSVQSWNEGKKFKIH
jgi:hypothetical protein